MMAGSHVLVGMAAWTLAAPALHQPVIEPACLALAACGALLPDIDHPSSWVGRRARVVSRPLAAVFGHRGITHSLLAVLGMVVLLEHYRVGRETVAPAAVGYLSHLAADGLTPRGLRLAWPARRAFALPLCRTGSAGEGLLVVLFVAAAVWRVVQPHLP